MLDMRQIADLARGVGRHRFGARSVKDVLTEPDLDSDGNDSVRITFVIGPGAARRLNGENILNALMDIHRRLEESGDPRYARVTYATPAELAADVDPGP